MTKVTMTAMALMTKARAETRVARMEPMVLPASRLSRKAMKRTPEPTGCRTKTRVKASVDLARAELKSASSTSSRTPAGS